MLEFYLLLVGLVAAFIDSSLGMGYGVSSVAVLISFGISPAIASASVHTVEGFVDVFSSPTTGNSRRTVDNNSFSQKLAVETMRFQSF